MTVGLLYHGNNKHVFSKGVYKTPDGYIGVFTLGELAKSKDLTREEFPGSILLKEAIAQIVEAAKITGGRFLLVDSLQLLYEKLYNQAGFIKIADREAPDQDDDLPYCVSILPLEPLV